MMLVTQLDEIVEVGGAAVDPVPHVVDVGELGVRAAGEAASLVAAPDLHPLGVTRIPPGSSEIEAPAIGIVGGDQDLGVAGQPPGHLP